MTVSPYTDSSVLVTGASTGIGRATALRLAEQGFQVFAGVRHAADAPAAPTDTITPVVLDITDADSIAEAQQTISAACGARGLYGLVNNAGIGVSGPVEHVRLHDVRRQFEVNVFAQLAVTQDFLPLLRQGAGRVLMVSSVGSWITMPFAGPLCASKHALRSFTDALRMEVRPWDLEVILIEPGSIRTAAVDKLEADVEPTVESLGPLGASRYGATYRDMARAAIAHEQAGAGPEVVADVVLEALTADRPRTRYLAGPNARRLSWAGRLLPNPALDAVRLRVLRPRSSRATVPSPDLPSMAATGR